MWLHEEGRGRHSKKLRDQPIELLLRRLCLEIGYPTPRHLLRELNSRDIADWIAYYSIEPFGPMHREQIGGVIASTVANCNRAKGQQAFAYTEFMPNYVAPEMTPEEMKANLQAWMGIADVDS